MKKFDVRFEATSNTLFISADFAKKASNTSSAEYRHLRELLSKNPTMKVEKRTRVTSNRLTYKDMETRLRRIDKNGKLVEAFELVKEIAKTEKSPYTFVYNWYKAQMETAKAEKENEKKASTPNKEDMLKKLAELTAGISYDAEEDVKWKKSSKRKKPDMGRSPIKNGGPYKRTPENTGSNDRVYES